MLSRLPMVSVKWKVKQVSSQFGEIMTGMSGNIKEKKWVDISISSEEDCTVQVELNRRTLYAGRRKVSPLVQWSKLLILLLFIRFIPQHTVHTFPKLKMKDGGWC